MVRRMYGPLISLHFTLAYDLHQMVSREFVPKRTLVLVLRVVPLRLLFLLYNLRFIPTRQIVVPSK